MRLLHWKMLTGALQYRKKNKKLQYREKKTYLQVTYLRGCGIAGMRQYGTYSVRIAWRSATTLR